MSLLNLSPVSNKTKKRLIRHVLLVEDSPSQALSVKATLEKEGLAVHIVNDGPEAIEAAQNHNFDLIVLDVELPTLNGYDTCRRLKLCAVTAHIPVILLTHRDRAVDTLKGLKLDIVDYIPKDVFAQATLLNTIRQLNEGNKL